jgi:hypothetical protein
MTAAKLPGFVHATQFGKAIAHADTDVHRTVGVQFQASFVELQCRFELLLVEGDARLAHHCRNYSAIIRQLGLQHSILISGKKLLVDTWFITKLNWASACSTLLPSSRQK